MTVTLVTTVTTLLAPTWNGSQWVRSLGSDETVLPGDSLIVLVGGGNHVTAYPGGDWVQVDLQTGQEAQGFIMTRRFTADPEASTWTVAFDGSDKALVSVLHFRGSDVAWEFDATLRSGAVGVTQAAGSVDITGPGKGDMEFYFAFARNAFGSLPTADGDQLAGLSLGNETGALYRDLPTVTDTKHVELPSRTGHYVVAVGVYIPTPGPWRSDSVEFWSSGPGVGALAPYWAPETASADNTVSQFSDDTGHTTPQASADAVWAGAGTTDLTPGYDSGPFGSPSFIISDTTPLGGPARYPASWTTVFASLARASGLLPGFVSGELPDTVYDAGTSTYIDPEVRDVEWETDPTPVGQRLHLTATTSTIPSGSFNATREAVTVYGIVEDAGATLSPSTFTGRASVQAGEALWTTDARTDETDYTGGLLGADPSAALRIRLAAVEHTTASGTAPTPPSDGTEIGGAGVFTAALEQSYRPLYRLIYRHVPDVIDTELVFYGDIPAPYAVTRLWPRDDQYGVSGPNRIYPPPRAGRIVGNQP